MRKGNLHALHAAALPEIQVIERAGADPDQGFARAGDRIGGIFVAKDLRSSVGMKPDGLHSVPGRETGLSGARHSDVGGQHLVRAETQTGQ